LKLFQHFISHVTTSETEIKLCITSSTESDSSSISLCTVADKS